ncbi:uncharacterized protein BDZ99DRAFT_562452 [Mytilinidion resinicola]|uniref:F-box domain-containing protein n=1 Tax=Mytilinidion resinicola TaxID=574789 RepID=A0A6A6YMU9_9PEZI|nr:uncharacterized protein BDZ99DRAFT_562452 [Mytilinidion resinicola]KAF2809879.1 hypothetical protein BDZ99DRAFT_562452 [Mytilinidion resinicola]
MSSRLSFASPLPSRSSPTHTSTTLLAHQFHSELSNYRNQIRPLRIITSMPSSLNVPKKRRQRHATPSEKAVKLGKESVSAASRVLHTVELVEMIINELENMTDIRHCGMVCKQWKGIVETSLAIQRRMILWWPLPPSILPSTGKYEWKGFIAPMAPYYQHPVFEDKKLRTSNLSMCMTVQQDYSIHLSFKQDLKEPILSNGFDCETATCRHLLISMPAPMTVNVRCTFYNISKSWDLEGTVSCANGVHIGDLLDCFRDMESLTKMADRMESKINMLLVIGGVVPGAAQSLIFCLWLARMGSKFLILFFFCMAVAGYCPHFGVQLLLLCFLLGRAILVMLRLRFGRNKIRFRGGSSWVGTPSRLCLFVRVGFFFLAWGLLPLVQVFLELSLWAEVKYGWKCLLRCLLNTGYLIIG